MAPAAKLRRFPTCAKLSASKKRAESGPGAEYNGDLSKADDAAGPIPGDDASAAAGHQAPAIFQRRAYRIPPRGNGAQSPARVRGTKRRRRAGGRRAGPRGVLRGERRRARRRGLGEGILVDRRRRIRREPRLRRLERLRLGRAVALPERSRERRGRRRAFRFLLDRHARRQRLLGWRDAESRGLCRFDEEPARNARGAALAGLRGSASTYDRPRADRCDR